MFITSRKKIEVEGAGGTKVWPIWLMVVHGFFGEGVFLSVICKDFLHLCDCLVLHYFLEASSIYSSIIERKREKRLIIKVGSIKKVGSCVCFPVSFSTYKTCKHCAF